MSAPDMLERNVEQLIRNCASPLPEGQVREAFADFVRRVKGARPAPKAEAFAVRRGRPALVASLLVCAMVVWLIVDAPETAPTTPPPGAAPSLQDPWPAEKIERVRSWYRILDGEEHVGFARIEIAKTGQGFRYSAGWGVRDLGESEPSVSRETEARLDGNFRLLDATVEERRGDAGGRLEVTGDRAIFRPEKGAAAETALPADRRTALDIDSALFRLTQTGRVGKGRMTYVPMLPPDGAGRPCEILLAVAGKEKRTYLRKQVEVLAVEVRRHPAKRPAERLEFLYLDRFGRIVETVAASGRKRILAGGESEARRGLGLLDRRGRRDPFDKKGAMDPVTPDDPGSNREAGLDPKKRAAELFLEMRELVGRLKVHSDEGDHYALKDLYHRFLGLYVPMRQEASGRSDAEQVRRLDDLKRAAELYYPGAERVRQEADSLFVRMGKLAARVEVTEMEKILVELEKLWARPELLASESLDGVRKLVAQGRELIRLAKIREELAAKKLVVSGVAVLEGERWVTVGVDLNLLGQRMALKRKTALRTREAHALINNSLYCAGDTVREAGVRVERIERHGVQVSYQGLVRDLPISSPERPKKR